MRSLHLLAFVQVAAAFNAPVDRPLRALQTHRHVGQSGRWYASAAGHEQRWLPPWVSHTRAATVAAGRCAQLCHICCLTRTDLSYAPHSDWVESHPRPSALTSPRVGGGGFTVRLVG